MSKRNKVNEYLFRTIVRGVSALIVEIPVPSSSRPSPLLPVPYVSRPVPSRPVPSRPVPSHLSRLLKHLSRLLEYLSRLLKQQYLLLSMTFVSFCRHCRLQTSTKCPLRYVCRPYIWHKELTFANFFFSEAYPSPLMSVRQSLHWSLLSEVIGPNGSWAAEDAGVIRVKEIGPQDQLPFVAFHLGGENTAK